jgi:hypothetical protein
MTPGEQVIIGVLAGLILCALFRWKPFVRDMLAAMAAAVFLDLMINEPTHRGVDLASRASRLPEEILSYPHFSLGVATAVAAVLASLHLFR